MPSQPQSSSPPAQAAAMRTGDVDRVLSERVSEWCSDHRMSFFMQAFKSHRDVNPSDWDSKLSFWGRVVRECLVHCERYAVVVSVRDLRERCLSRTRREGDRRRQTSLGWKTVISELQKKNELVTLQEFRNVYDAESGQGMGRWLMENVVSKPANWLWKWTTSGNKISISDMSDGRSATGGGSGDGNGKNKLFDESTPLVVMFNVRYLSEEFESDVYETQIEHYDLLLCPSEIRNYFKKKNAKRFSLKDEEISVLVNYIAASLNSIIIPIKQGQGLKFFARGEKKRKLDDVELESDRAILQLKEMLQVLERQKVDTEIELNRCVHEIKRLLKASQKQQACYVLRRKKLLEAALNKRLASIQNVASIYHEIQSAKTDMQVFDALKTGGHTLQKHTEDLKQMKVEDTLDSISDALTDYSDIRAVMDMGMDAMKLKNMGDVENEEELLRELEELEISETEAEDEEGALVTKRVSSKGKEEKALTEEVEEKRKKKVEKAEEEKDSAREGKKDTTPATTESAAQKSRTAADNAYRLPSIDMIPQSQKILQSELERTEEILKNDGDNKEAKKLRHDIEMALKLIRLKRKRKSQVYISSLESKLEDLQEKATSDNVDTSQAVQWMKWIELIETELEEMAQSVVEEKRKAVAA